MATKKIQINERNSSNTAWDTIHPETSADVVRVADTGNKLVATNVEGALAELADKATNAESNAKTYTDSKVKITDTTTGAKYVWKVENGALFIEEV